MPEKETKKVGEIGMKRLLEDMVILLVAVGLCFVLWVVGSIGLIREPTSKH